MNGNDLISGFLVSLIGSGFLMYGKKQRRVPQTTVGLIAIVYPYFVSGPWLIFGILAALLGLMWFAIRLGY